MRYFAHFSSLLVKGNRNVGEAGVLALAKAVTATAVIDDSAATRAAARNNVRYRRTLGLIVDMVHSGLLTKKLASAVVDDLLLTEYRLPLEAGEFEDWATEKGLF